MGTILPYVPAIAEKLFEYPIVILKAATGMGKSLILPPSLAKMGYRVFVSMPTRLAVTAAYANAKNIFPDVDFGYAAEGDIRYNNSSQCVYASFGHIKRKLMGCIDKETGKAKDINFCDILVHDEMHNSGVDNGMNIMLSIYIKKSGARVPRFLMTTATIKEKYMTLFPDAYPMVIEGVTHPVDIIYSQKDYLKYDFKEDNYFFLDLVKTILVAINTVKNNILVFFPGKNEVSTTRKYMEDHHKDKLNNIRILEIYSGNDPNDQKIIENKDYQGRLIIFATNIAETSVSIHRLDCVVDSMLEKILVATETGSTKLETTLISKASATQRKGRVGRFSIGRCYRMITERRYETLEANLEDEIMRLPVEKPLLEIINLRINVYDFFIELPRSKIAEALNNLIRFNCIQQTDSGLLILDKGLFIGDLQTGIKLSSVLYDWYNLGYPLDAGIIAISLIDSASPSYFFGPKPKKDEDLNAYNLRYQKHVEQYFTKYFAHSDVETYLLLWNDYMDNVRGDYSNKDVAVKFASKNSINAQKLKDALLNIKNTTQSISGKLKQSIDIGSVDVDRTMLRILPLLANSYSDTIMFSRGGKYVDIRNNSYKLDRAGINKINLKRDYTVIPITKLLVDEATRVSVAIPYNLSVLYNI